VVAVLPRGEAIRNFVYSGCLDQVQARADLSVVSVLPPGEVEDLLRSRYRDVHELVPTKPPYALGALFDVVDVAHNRYLWSEAAQERWRRRDAEATTRAQQLKTGAKRALARPFANDRSLRALTDLQTTLAARSRANAAHRELLAGVEPDLVFNGSHIHSAAAHGVVAAARARSATTAAFLFSWDNLTSQGRIMPPYDAHLVWNADIRADLLRIYPRIDPERVVVTGTPQFDAHFRDEHRWTREEYCRAVGLDPARPIVLYSTGMPNHMPGETEIVTDLADRLAALGPDAPQLVVRRYAKDRSGRFEALHQARPDLCMPEVAWEATWLTPLPGDTPLWSNMLRHTDVGVNVASTVSLELCMFDVPVVQVAYNPPGVPTSEIDYARYYRFDHYRPVVESGAVTLARSADDLVAEIRRALEVPEVHAAERRALLDRMFGDTLDGRSADRIATTLVDLAGSR
jgi:hypothetical protein